MNNIKQCYDWDTNILDFNDKYGNHYYLQLRGNKNIIKGSSGTGKTYLYKKLSKIKQKLNNSAIDIINVDNDNRYLIFTRVPLGIEISPNHQAEFIKEGNKTILKYRFNVKGWS